MKTRKETRKVFPRLALLGTFALGSMTCAYAADNGSGWYGTLGLGRSSVQSSNVDGLFANQGLSSSSSIDKHDTNYSLGVGYQFNQNFAVEGGYVDLGKFNVGSTISAPAADTAHGNYKVDGWNVSAVGILPLDKGFALYGKAGFILADTKLSASSDTGATNVSGGSKTTVSPTYGLGVSYKFTQNVDGRLGWDRYQDLGSDSSTGKLNLNTYTVGLAVHF